MHVRDKSYDSYPGHLRRSSDSLSSRIFAIQKSPGKLRIHDGNRQRSCAVIRTQEPPLEQPYAEGPKIAAAYRLHVGLKVLSEPRRAIELETSTPAASHGHPVCKRSGIH